MIYASFAYGPDTIRKLKSNRLRWAAQKYFGILMGQPYGIRRVSTPGLEEIRRNKLQIKLDGKRWLGSGARCGE